MCRITNVVNSAKCLECKRSEKNNSSGSDLSSNSKVSVGKEKILSNGGKEERLYVR